MIQMKAISRRTNVNLEQQFMERAAALRSEVANRIAADIVDFSPVDTGTYIMAHVAGTGQSDEPATRSSAGKARGRSKAQFANLALGNLRRSVSARAIMGSQEIWFRNRSEHAMRVEYTGWLDRGGREAYHVYAQAGRRVAIHIDAVAAEMGFTAR